ncbi:MAG: hypothetical protein J6Y36_09495 [Treponema sp.]|nr:hypothetical protein [Treponema sp.]
MKKVFVLLIASLILFSSCVSIGSREFPIEPVNVVVKNFDIAETVIVRLDINLISISYEKKLSKKEYGIFDSFLVSNEIDDEMLIQPQKVDLGKNQLEWHRFWVGESINLFNLNNSKLEDRVVLLLRINNHLYFIDSNYIGKKTLFRLNEDRTFTKLDVNQYENLFSVNYDKDEKHNFEVTIKLTEN